MLSAKPTASASPLPDDGLATPERVGWLRLRYADVALEQAFGGYYQQALLPRMRRSLVVVLVLFLAFAVLDVLSMPPQVYQITLLLRLGVILPLLWVVRWALRAPQMQPHLQAVVAGAGLLCGLDVVAVIWVARAHAFALPYEGILLSTLFCYLLVGLRFAPAALCGWFVFAAYLGMELYEGVLGDALAYNALFLATTNLVGCFGCHYLEKIMRQNFVSTVRLQQMADKDYVTGLFNRRAFVERAQSAWRQAQREGCCLALAMLDVDHFKRYNDHYGHVAGDEALRQVAQAVASQARRPLDVCARYGGEEFVVLWFGVDDAQALVLAERVRADLARRAVPHAASLTSDRLGVSIGVVTLCPVRGDDFAAGLARADEALYQAKAQGRNRVIAFAAEEDSSRS